MKRIALIALAAIIALFLGGCCYQQSYGPSFEEEQKASKGRTWYFGFKAQTKPLISAPLLLKDNLYVTSIGGMVYCVDKEKGMPVETFTFNQSRPLKGGFRSGPITDGKSVYIGCYDHNIYAIEPGSGMVQWVFPTSGQIEGAPVMMEGRIYVGAWTKRLYCLDKKDGSPIWEFTTSDKVRSTPAAFDGKVYFGDASGSFYCISTGGSQPKLEWEFQAGDEIYGEPATDGEAVWFTSLDRNIYCLDASSGEQRWVHKTGGPIWAGPYVDTFKTGTATAEEIEIVVEGDSTDITTPTGEVINPAIDNGSTEPGESAEKEPVSMEVGKLVKRLYVGSMDAKFYILDAGTGELATYFDPELGEEVPIQPYSRPDAAPNDHGIQGSAVTDDKYVYFGAGDFMFRALDKVTGKLVWDFMTRGEIRSKPLVYEGKVVFGCDDAYFYGLKTENGYPVKGAEQQFE